MFAIAIAIAMTTIACAAKVVSRDGVMTSPAWPSPPFPASVALENFSGQASDGKFSEGQSADGLAQILLDQKVFARVKAPGSGDGRTDLILRGDVQSHWDARGAANFFIWWPGGLVFAPNWYGTRMRFFTQATVELVDAGTGARVGEYSASTSHELVHRSASPGPFFGALIVVPGVVRGATLTWPRAKYKAMVQPVAYAELWQRVAAEIVKDRKPVYIAEAEARRRRCGARLDLPPSVGQSWEAFYGCESSYYEATTQVMTDEGRASIFVNPADGSTIYVIDGAIARWQQAERMPAVGAGPRPIH
jgi:hypothetical protein